MSKVFKCFIESIRGGLQKRGFDKDKIDAHIKRVIVKYENSPIFVDEVIDDEEDFDIEFCDGITELPVDQSDALPFIALKKTRDEIIDHRINQLSVHYENLQEESGEIWFPDLDENDPDYVNPINETDIFGRTPVIEASINGDIRYVRELIELGADLEIKDNSGNSAFNAAILNGHCRIAKILKKAMKETFPAKIFEL